MDNIFSKTNISSRFYIFLSIVLIIAVADTFVLSTKFQSGSVYRNFSNHIESIETEVLKLESFIDIYLASLSVPNYTAEAVIEDIKEQSYVLSKVISDLPVGEYAEVINNNKNIAGTIKDINFNWGTIEIDLLLFYSAFTDDDIYLIHNNIDLNSSLLSDELSILELKLDDLSLDAEEDGTMHIVMVLAVSFLIIALSSFLFIKGSLSPLNRFKELSRRISSGDLSTRFDDSLGGEYEELSRALNEILESVHRTKSDEMLEVDRLSKFNSSHMIALVSIINLAGKSVSDYEFFNKAIQDTIDAIDAKAGAVYMVNFEKLELKVSKGFKGTFFEDASELPIEDRQEGVKLSRVSRVFSDIDSLPSAKYRPILESNNVASIVCTPILRGDSVIGYMDIMFDDPSGIDEHVSFIDVVALSIGVVVGYTELFLEAHSIRRYLERLFDQQPTGMAVVGTDGTCSLANVALKNIFGCTSGGEVVGRYDYNEDANFTSNDFLKSIESAFEGVGGDIILDYDPMVVKGCGFMGTTKKIEIKVTPMYDSSGNIPDVMLTFIEVREGGAK